MGPSQKEKEKEREEKKLVKVAVIYLQKTCSLLQFSLVIGFIGNVFTVGQKKKRYLPAVTANISYYSIRQTTLRHHCSTNRDK